MLNKPTNIYPYNDFVNTTDGFSFKFNLSNSATYAVVAVFESDTDKLIETLPLYGSSFRSRSESEVEATIAKYTANTDCYWRCYYWVDPNSIFQYSNAVPLFSRKSGSLTYYNVPILAWDKTARTIDIEATPTHDITASDLIYWRRNSSYKCDVGLSSNKTSLVNTIINDINNGAEYWGTIPGLIPPQQITGFNPRTSVNAQNLWEIIPNMTCNYQSLGDSSILYIYKMSQSQDNNIGLCTAGDCLQFNCGINPSPMLSVESSELIADGDNIVLRIKTAEPFYFDLTYNETAKNYGMVGGYRNAEFNVSPPYYFSVRNKLHTSLAFAPSDNSSMAASPSVKITATAQIKDSDGEVRYKEFDVDYYYYTLYAQDKNKQSFSLVEKSDKKTDLSIKNTTTSPVTFYYKFEDLIIDGLKWNSTYKLKLTGRSCEGMNFEEETVFRTSSFEPTARINFVSFDSDLGCIKINNKLFTSKSDAYTLHIYRYDISDETLSLVCVSDYVSNTAKTGFTDSSGNSSYTYKKTTFSYDFNIASSREYIYYAFLMNGTSIISSYKSNVVNPEWYGVYLTDLSQISGNKYTPDISSCWFIYLNYEPDDVTRNYSVSHPQAVNQKYPKSVRGKSNFKTGSVSGLLGHVSCYDDYAEDISTADKWDEFCGNGNLKLLRGNVSAENIIADIDKMTTSLYGHTATLTNIGYTQIDDLKHKQISIEV